MTRTGPIGGGGRRRGRPRGGVPIRPLRWFSGASETDDVANDPCRVKVTSVFCDVDEGLTAQEILSGVSDLEVMDRSECTVTRVVGQLSWDYNQSFNSDSPQIQIPYIRAGLVTVDADQDLVTWVPPDLWSRDDLQEVQWMWLRQGNFSEGTALQAYASITTTGGDSYVQFRMNWDVDCPINRKVSKAGHLMLVYQSHYAGPVSTGLQTPLVGLVQNLRILVKG